jgi:hydroxymethylglutaryl-CoA reductase (NADPH)
VEDPAQWPALRSAFEGTTAFGQLRAAHCTVAGRNVYVRFVCFAGDAMGMNMVSKVLY